MIITTTSTNGSVVTEYQNYFSKGCGCNGGCNCISQTYPKYDQQHYLLNGQKDVTHVVNPMNNCIPNNQQDNTFYRTDMTSNQNIINYNILPKVNKEADNYNPFVLNPFAINSYLQTGYPANVYPVPKNKDWALVQGNGIRFEEYETGLKIHNQGVLRVSIAGVVSSGVTVINTGTLQESNFVIGINNKEFAINNNLVQEVVFNGKSYTPNNGVVFINSGASGSPITTLTSIDNSIAIIPTSIGTYNIQTAKVTVKGVPTKTTLSNQKLVDFVDGVNTTPKITNDNQVSFDVTGIVKTVNNQTPDLNGNVTVAATPLSIFFQYRKVLALSDISSFQSSGVDIVSMSINQGMKPNQIVSSDGVMLYLNSDYLPLDKYTRAGNVITINNSVSLNANDSLSIVVIKSV